MARANLTRIAAAVAALPLLAPQIGVAAVYSGGSRANTFDVTMKIIADCSIAATPLDFGQSQGVLDGAVNATSSLQISCTSSTPYNVGLSAGSGAGSTVGARQMSGTGPNAGTVAYNLSMTPGGGNWGNTQGTDTQSGTGTGGVQNLTVYGVVPTQATPQPDSYRSTITATVYF